MGPRAWNARTRCWTPRRECIAEDQIAVAIFKGHRVNVFASVCAYALI